MSGRLFGLNKRQEIARRGNDEKIVITNPQQAVRRRHGLVARSGEWYTSPLETFSLAPGDPGAPWGTGHRRRVLHDVATTPTRMVA